MEIYENKASKMYFIYIDDTNINEALFVTPECKIKSLNLNLFNKPDNKDKDYLSRNLINKEQIERYHQYKTDRKNEIVTKVDEMFRSMTSWEKECFLYELKNC